jgi:hypothetical protein
MQTAKSTGMRRRNSNRMTNRYRPGRVGSSFGQPVPVSFFLGDALEAVRKRDIRKVCEILTLKSHG